MMTLKDILKEYKEFSTQSKRDAIVHAAIVNSKGIEEGHKAVPVEFPGLSKRLYLDWQ